MANDRLRFKFDLGDFVTDGRSTGKIQIQSHKITTNVPQAYVWWADNTKSWVDEKDLRLALEIK